MQRAIRRFIVNAVFRAMQLFIHKAKNLAPLNQRQLLDF